MRDLRTSTNLIVIHCSATTPDMDIGVKEIDEWHKARGWQGIGYHVVIRRSGLVEFGEHLSRRGAHAYGHNHNSIGICLVGGISPEGESSCNFTQHQNDSLLKTLGFLDAAYRNSKPAIVGHRDLSPDIDGDGEVEPWEWKKDCPCFNVNHYLRTLEFKFF